tara:strand:- start:1273 stop:1515 length:243 start_codon:yes stop_codon:yes gene_type:complete
LRSRAACRPFDHHVDSDRRRWWKLRDTTMLGMQGMYDHELVALGMGIRRAEREGALSDAEALQDLRDRLLATLPAPHGPD